MDIQKLVVLLRRGTASNSLKLGKLVHQRLFSLGLQKDAFITKHLIQLYCSLQLFDSAWLVLQTAGKSSEISMWNGLLAAYSKNSMYNEALCLFKKLKHCPYVTPDEYTYPSVIKACGGLQNIHGGRKIHSLVIKSAFESDVVVSSALVFMYAKCSVFDYAIIIFNEMPTKDVASWNTVISSYYQSGQPEKALEMFHKMKYDGFKPDAVTFTTVFSACARLSKLKEGQEIHQELIGSGFELDTHVGTSIVDMYGKCGQLQMARDFFEQLSRKSVVCWNSMIGGYALANDISLCFELFFRMKEEGINPTSTTLSSLLIVSSKTVNLGHGMFIHGYIIKNTVDSDIYMDCSLIDLYLKCGKPEFAKRVFNKTPKTNVVTWNVMVSGYVSVGSYFQALDTFNEMRSFGVRPDAVTCISFLSACSQLAALQKGKEIHGYIVDSKVDSDEIVMSALLDMYAKCGAVDDARQIFDSLPNKDIVSWTSMIVAYGSHGRAVEALDIFEKMVVCKVGPDLVAFLAVLSACSHAGLVDEGYHYFNMMIQRYAMKPTMEHYSCLIDLLGRSGRLMEAFAILKSNPIICQNEVLLTSLLFACNKHGNFELGETIGRALIDKLPDDSSTYYVLINLYASARKWDEVRKLRFKMSEKGLKKCPGYSWIEVDKRIYPFSVDDKWHPQLEVVSECLEILKKHMDKEQSLLQMTAEGLKELSLDNDP